MASTYEELSKAKRDQLAELIPEKWRLDTLPPTQKVRDVSGSYLHQYLTPREIEITETDAVGITEHTTTGQWTAVEVTEAFCHRAALAQQLVCPKCKPYLSVWFRLEMPRSTCIGYGVAFPDSLCVGRSIVCTRYFLMTRWKRQKSSTRILPNTVVQSVASMVCQSV